MLVAYISSDLDYGETTTRQSYRIAATDTVSIELAATTTTTAEDYQ